MTSPTHYLSPSELSRLCDFLYRRTGMLFGESKRYYIDRRVAERIGATNSLSFPAYFAVLVSQPTEAELLINNVTRSVCKKPTQTLYNQFVGFVKGCA